MIGVNDIVRKNAKDVISKLEKHNIKTIMLTGDNKETAEKIGKELGITKVISNVLPSQKSETIKKLKEDRNRVMMCGDGINDSPSLTNSDVGVSVDTAVDIAKESADIILLEKDLNVLLDGVEERKTYICKFDEIYKNGNKLQLWRGCICNSCKYIFTVFARDANSIIS